MPSWKGSDSEALGHNFTTGRPGGLLIKPKSDILVTEVSLKLQGAESGFSVAIYGLNTSGIVDLPSLWQLDNRSPSFGWNTFQVTGGIRLLKDTGYCITGWDDTDWSMYAVDSGNVSSEWLTITNGGLSVDVHNYVHWVDIQYSVIAPPWQVTQKGRILSMGITYQFVDNPTTRYTIEIGGDSLFLI